MNKRRAAPPPPPPPPDPAAVRRALLGKSVAAIQARAQRGEVLTKAQMAQVEEFLALSQPAPAAPPPDLSPGGPPDITIASGAELARVLGVHENTIANWREAGHLPATRPYALKDVCLRLRRAGKLGSCKPTRQDVHAVWSWAFAGNAEGAVNPDDPAHAAPSGWEEEYKRQLALGGLEQRLRARIERETLEGERIPVEEYARRRRRDAGLLVAMLDSVHAAMAKVDGLTLDQRRAVNEALAAWVGEVRGRLAEHGDSTDEPADGEDDA